MPKPIRYVVVGSLIFLLVWHAASLDVSAALPRADYVSREQPRRVLLLGDSLSASIESKLAERLDELGIEFRYAGFPGTGPLTSQGQFWRDEMHRGLAEFEPDLVLIQPSGNYNIGGGDPFVVADGSGLDHGTEDFFEAWEGHLRDLVDLAYQSGSSVGIITAPVASGHADSHSWTERHNAGYERLAAEVGVSVFDWNEILAPDGRYLTSLEIAGTRVPIRSDDGLHFSDAGSTVVAGWLAHRLV
jgi:lysophospholipase L1-like esterase